jgi:3-deoxy-D-manno-octulosonic-acid transferase
MTIFFLRALITTYSCIMETAGVLAAVALRWSHLSKSWNIRQRRSIPVPRKPGARPSTVWLHAASMGEAKLLLRFLDILRSRYPHQAYLLTATTRTGVEYLQAAEGGDIYAAGFLPLDTVRLMRSVLSTFCVSRVWLLETELWPCMLWSCFTKGVPVGLVNARIEEASLRWYRRFAWLVGPLLSHPDIILAQDQAYADRFARLGVSRSRIRVTGNLKRNVSIHPLSKEERARLRVPLCLGENDRCITAGCVHPGEATVIAEALAALKRMSFPVKCIVVPRHLKDAPLLARELGNGVVRLGEPAAAETWEVCMVEKMGVMEALYKIADAAIIGGTFDDTGGHNMWDAAQFGIPVVFGPNFRTQKESGDSLLAAGVAFCSPDAEGLALALAAALRDAVPAFASAQSAFAKAVNAAHHNIEDLIP